ncbi:MAG: methyltransferase [Treponema sp.]|nr:methyltransferase [Treponema sp.]
MNPYAEAYGNKQVQFRFRGVNYSFALTHGLFSSNDIDTGTRLLLKVFSGFLDSDIEKKIPLPRRVLDAGCGAGVLGICAAGAIIRESLAAGGQSARDNDARDSGVYIRAQDRDELARQFTLYNAEKNNIPPYLFDACTEPLLACEAGLVPTKMPGAIKAGAFKAGSHWDLILANIPAKAGEPVLADFIGRSAGMLAPGGRVMMVAVNPLADFFRAELAKAGIPIISETTGPGHTVFVWCPKDTRGPADTRGPTTAADAAPDTAASGNAASDESFFAQYPYYLRSSGEYTVCNTSYRLDTVYGAADFDNPGFEIQTAAKLFAGLKPDAAFLKKIAQGPMLVYEGGPGHFPVWLISYLTGSIKGPLVLAGRNILALKAAQHNCLAALKNNINAGIPDVRAVPSADLLLDQGLLKINTKSCYTFMAIFPELVPVTDRLGALWEGIKDLLAPGGLVIISLASADAEKLLRKKPQGFAAAADIKRSGYRAMAFVRLPF